MIISRARYLDDGIWLAAFIIGNCWDNPEWMGKD